MYEKKYAKGSATCVDCRGERVRKWSGTVLEWQGNGEVLFVPDEWPIHSGQIVKDFKPYLDSDGKDIYITKLKFLWTHFRGYTVLIPMVMLLMYLIANQ